MIETLDSIASVTVRKVVVPFNIPPRTASGSLDNFAVVLIDLETHGGVTGRSYVWSFAEIFLTPLAETVRAVGELVVDEVLAPVELERKLRKQLKLIDTPGLIGLALAGIDMAVWDAHARRLRLPLAVALGSDVESVPAYNSCGLWIQDVATLPDETKKLSAMNGFNAVKLRLGRASVGADIAAISAVRDNLASDSHLMVDYNQSLTVDEALRIVPALDQQDLYWIEEPVRHADIFGQARISLAASTPIQVGENLCDDFALQRAIRANAADLYMPDLQRIGGVTGWQRASALCHASELKMSSHLFPEFSVHVLAASPTQHWLEYVDWANVFLLNPLKIHNGMALVPDRPGAGIEWDEDAVGRYQVQ